MGINIGDNLNYQGSKFNVERDSFQTKALMKAYPETSLPPKGFRAYCAEDDEYYEAGHHGKAAYCHGKELPVHHLVFRHRGGKQQLVCPGGFLPAYYPHGEERDIKEKPSLDRRIDAAPRIHEYLAGHCSQPEPEGPVAQQHAYHFGEGNPCLDVEYGDENPGYRGIEQLPELVFRYVEYSLHFFLS